jgi:hypothetical protein
MGQMCVNFLTKGVASIFLTWKTFSMVFLNILIRIRNVYSWKNKINFLHSCGTYIATVPEKFEEC